MNKRTRLQIYFGLCVALPLIAAFLSAYNRPPAGEVLEALRGIKQSIDTGIWWILAAIIALRLDRQS